MRTCTHRLILAAALVALNGPAALTATEYEATDYLPLAVGNSWRIGHSVYDPRQRLPGSPRNLGGRSSWSAWEDSGGVFTMTVERTEVLDGATYYVLSDLPTGGWPPTPPGFIAGKKLRWEGTQLMEHTGAGEQTLYHFVHFGDQEVFEYDGLPGHEAAKAYFGFSTDDLEEWVRATFEEVVGPRQRGCSFLARYGFRTCMEEISVSDYSVFVNSISCSEAVLIESAQGTGGARGESGTVVRRVSYDEARRGEEGSVTSSLSSSSWGQVKETESGR